MAKSFTMAQLNELLDIHENTIIIIFTNRIENLESKITSMQGEKKQLKDEVKALQESIEYMKKDMTEKKQKLETDNRNNRNVRKIIQQNTKMKDQIAELQDRHRQNNLRFMGIKEKSGIESETWEESEKTFFCKKNCV